MQKLYKKRTNKICNDTYLQSWSNMEWICKWFIFMLLSATMAHRQILLILSTFEGVLITRKHSSIFRIKAKLSLAFIHALVLILGSFLLIARRSAICNKKLLHSLPVQNMIKTWKHKWCSTWRVCWLYILFFPFSFFLRITNSWKTVV